MSKTCTNCQIEKPLSDFSKGEGRLGLRPKCRQCRADYNREWRSKTPRKPRPSRAGSAWEYNYDAAYYAANRPKYKARRNAYRAQLRSRTPEQVQVDRLRLRPDGLKQCDRCRLRKPLESFYQAALSADGLMSRCRQCCNASGLVTPAVVAWWSTNGMDRSTCTYCGETQKPMHVDHIVPRLLGGDDSPENLAPACEGCNTSKGSKMLSHWLNG